MRYFPHIPHIFSPLSLILEIVSHPVKTYQKSNTRHLCLPRCWEYAWIGNHLFFLPPPNFTHSSSISRSKKWARTTTTTSVLSVLIRACFIPFWSAWMTFWAHISYIFLKVHKICNRLINDVAIFGKSHFSPYGGAPGGYFAPRGIFYWFLAYGSDIFLKVNKICNRLIYCMTIFGNFDYSPCAKHPGGIFCIPPGREAMHSSPLIVSLPFLD